MVNIFTSFDDIFAFFSFIIKIVIFPDENSFIQEVLKLSESETEIPNLGNLTELT